MGQGQTLTLDEAYQAAYLWLDHIGDPPLEISEPAHGAVELVTERLFVRVRLSDGPVEQSSVLALLRAAEAGKKLLIFSPSGFSPGAVSIAETQGIGLFALDATGRAAPETTHARAMMPDTEPEPPFVPQVEESGDSFWDAPEEPEQRRKDDEEAETIDVGTFDWDDCPQCGTTHHRNAKFCRECGTDLRAAALEQEAADRPNLRCRTCGSFDIEHLD